MSRAAREGRKIEPVAGLSGGATAFAVGAGVMTAGLLAEEVLGVTNLDVWPWMVAAGVAVSVALVRLARSTRPQASVPRVLAMVGGAGAITYVLSTLIFRAAAASDAALPTQLEGLFVVGALLFLGGIVMASALIALALLRAPDVPTSVGMLLMGASLLFLSPLIGLLTVEPPGWFPTVSVSLLALLLLSLALRIRATA